MVLHLEIVLLNDAAWLLTRLLFVDQEGNQTSAFSEHQHLFANQEYYQPL